MSPGRFLGIDYGLKRIGLAVSDPSGLVARELAIIQRTTNQEDFRRIHQHIAEQRVSAIVIGTPAQDAAGDAYTLDDRIRNWVARFQATTALPIILWNESLTSADAREIAIRQRRTPREPIDDLAARLILQSYLDALHDGLATPPSEVTLP